MGSMSTCYEVKYILHCYIHGWLSVSPEASKSDTLHFQPNWNASKTHSQMLQMHLHCGASLSKQKVFPPPGGGGGQRARGEGGNCQVSFSDAKEMYSFVCLFPFLLLNFLLPKQGKAAHHYPGLRLLVENRAQEII